MKYIIAENLVAEINLNEMLSAEVNDRGEIEIEYLGKCGDDLVADCIEREWKSDHLKWQASNEADSIAIYSLYADICEPCEGGIVAFDDLGERATWLNQI